MPAWQHFESKNHSAATATETTTTSCCYFSKHLFVRTKKHKKIVEDNFFCDNSALTTTIFSLLASTIWLSSSVSLSPCWSFHFSHISTIKSCWRNCDFQYFACLSLTLLSRHLSAPDYDVQAQIDALVRSLRHHRCNHRRCCTCVSSQSMIILCKITHARITASIASRFHKWHGEDKMWNRACNIPTARSISFRLASWAIAKNFRIQVVAFGMDFTKQA
jgi:hypothetical protein